MADAVSATNVKDNPQDAQASAVKRMNGTLSKFRMLANTTSWALSADDRNSMADAIEVGAAELVSLLRGQSSGNSTAFTF